MSTSNPFATSPFFAQWLSLAESATGAWQKALAGDLARQSAEMMVEFNRQVLSTWTAAWAPTAAQRATAPAEAEAAVSVAPVETPAEPVVAPVLAAVEAEKPRRAPRAKAQAVATPQRRKAAPITAKLPRGKRVTRH